MMGFSSPLFRLLRPAGGGRRVSCYDKLGLGLLRGLTATGRGGGRSFSSSAAAAVVVAAAPSSSRQPQYPAAADRAFYVAQQQQQPRAIHHHHHGRRCRLHSNNDVDEYHLPHRHRQPPQGAGAGARRSLATASAATPPAVNEEVAAATMNTNTMTMNSNTQIILYQYNICPFCHRVKALLDYVGASYQVIEVNPLTKTEIKQFNYKKVPILETVTVDNNNNKDEQQQQAPLLGSDVIIQGLLEMPIIQERLKMQWNNNSRERDKENNNNEKIMSMTLDEFGHQSPNVIKWTNFAVNELASLLYPNMCRTYSDSYRAFDYVHRIPTFGTFQRFLIQNIGSLAMYMAASKVKKKRNITDERQALEDALTVLDKALDSQKSGSGASVPFLSGRNDADLGDLAVFGVLRAIEGLPVHQTLILDRTGSSPIPAWYRRMSTLMNKNK